jgi:hypothetical protein
VGPPDLQAPAPNAADAACGSDLMRWTVCFVRFSVRAMVERLGALAFDKADRTRSSVARSWLGLRPSRDDVTNQSTVPVVGSDLFLLPPVLTKIASRFCRLRCCAPLPKPRRTQVT